MKRTDAELLLLFIQQLSEAAFRAIVERHQDLVFCICRRRLGDSELAADATQNVFMALASNAVQLDPGPLEGYLAKTAIRVCTAMRLARAARERHERRYRRLNPERYLPSDRQDEPRIQLKQAMSVLSERYREPLTLRYIDGLSVEAVGTALDLSRHAVRKRLVRALTHLRQQMEAQGMVASIAMMAGMLGQMRGSATPPSLTERIVDAIFSSPTGSIAYRIKPARKLRVYAALSTSAAAAAAIIVVVVTVLPRSQPGPAVPVAAGASTAKPPQTSPSADPPSFQQRLDQKLPSLIDQHGRFDFTLTTLSAMSDVPIEARWNAIEANGISRRSPVVLKLQDKTLLEDLDTIFPQVAPPGVLEYVISEGRIIVQPRPASAELPQTVTLRR